MEFNKMPLEELIKKLNPPKGKIRMVLDTDTYNEIDDQFALAYALKSSEKLQLEAVYAAPFHNNRSENAGDGMEKSYNEILNIYKLLNMYFFNAIGTYFISTAIMRSGYSM